MKCLLIKQIFTELYFIPGIGLDDENRKKKKKGDPFLKELMFSWGEKRHKQVNI